MGFLSLNWPFSIFFFTDFDFFFVDLRAIF